MSSQVPFASSSQVPFAPNVVPPSPEAATLAAYADIPVSLYTGIPEIAIPLYQLVERDLSVPISLSYHASAHKVGDEASRVGLGWSVNAGGTITRSIRGLPDEYRPGGFLHQAAEVGQVGAYALGSKENRFQRFDAMARGCRSAEPDIYYFTFGHYSGKFQFDWDGSIRIGSEPKLVITPIGLDPNNVFIQGWEVVTPDGIRWTFSIKESIATRFQGGAILSDPCRAILESKKPPQAWHLAKIESPFTGSRVVFRYTDYFQILERWSLETQVHNDHLAPAAPKREKVISEVRGEYLAEVSTSSGDTTIEFLPGRERSDVVGSELRVLDGVIVRNRHTDIVKRWEFGYDNSTSKLTLRSLREANDSGSKPPFSFEYYPGRLPSALSFSQDHWGFPNNNPQQTLVPRTVVPLVGSNPVILDGADRSSAPEKLTVGMLRRITYPTGGTDQFDFEPHDYSFEQNVQLKSPVTASRSIGGEAPAPDTPSGEEHVDRTPFKLDDDVELRLTASFTYGIRFGGANFANPVVDIETSNGKNVFTLAPGGAAAQDGQPTVKTLVVVFNAKANSDTVGAVPVSASLPPGSYVFIVRCKNPIATTLGRNSVRASLAWQQPTGKFTTKKVQGAGVRIARITRTCGFGNPDMVKTYHYSTEVEGEEVSSGSLLEAHYIYERWVTYLENIGGPTFPTSKTVQKFVRFSQNRSALGTTHGSHVGYRKVTVSPGAEQENGKSVYTYTSAIDFPDRDIDVDIPFAPPMSRDFMRGLLLEQSDYKVGDGPPVRRIINTYNFIQHNIPALRVGWRIPGDGPTGAEFVDRYAVKGYSNLVGYGRLTNREEHLHEPPNSFITRASYEHQEDGHKQLTRETTASSAGIFTTEYRYPTDYPRGTSAGIDELVKLHVVSTWIEKVRHQRVGSSTAVLSAQRNRYGLFEGKVHKTHIETAAIAEPVITQGSIFGAVADLYEPRLIYRAYDGHGNILEYSQPGGMATSLLWDTAGTQLVAKVDNATRGQVYYDGFEDAVQGTTAQAYTGSRSKLVSAVYRLEAARLPRLSGDYLLSYWKKSGAAPWTRVERVIRDYVPGSAISTDLIGGFLDELRLHPLDAAMTSFAYQPLVGLRTAVNANGLATYYEYDSLGRLATVLDRNRDIRKHHEYAFTLDVLDGSAASSSRPSHVRTYKAQVSGIKTVERLTHDHRPRNVEESTRYLDGMGRMLQSVRRSGSPAAKDMVQILSYDQFGREATTFLPFTTAANDGAFTIMDPSDHPLLRFYSSEDPEVAKTKAPFALTRFDGSPLNRVIERGAPGEAWQPHAGDTPHTQRFEYPTNTAADRVLRWRTLNGELRADKEYRVGALRMERTIDEHDGRLSVFYDGRGREILRVEETSDGQEASTYFLYDAQDNLVVVIPPRAAAQPSSHPLAPFSPKRISQEELKRECYRYEYDQRNRMVVKALPGVESIFMVYDQWDRLALSQDGNQRRINHWKFQKYDAHDRLIMIGEIVIKGSRNDIAQALEDFYASEPRELRYEVAGQTHGYSNRSFPLLDESARVDRVLYFDDYSFVNTLPSPRSYVFQPEPGASEALDRAVGQETGSKVRIFGTGRFISSVRYYDGDYRQVQVLSNDHLGGRCRETTEYDFSGKVLSSQFTHRRSEASVRLLKRRTYDHAGRPTSVVLEVDDANPVVLSTLEYNSLGQLIRKRLHADDDVLSSGQEIEYRYNIRGWLTSINPAAIERPTDTDKLFAMLLSYEDQLNALANVPQFNGNISAVRWRNAHTDEVQAYVYEYDGFDRLAAAQYRMSGAKNHAFDETGIAYDPNGNLLRVSRHAFISSQRTAIDRLQYQYTGNQVRAIRDFSGRQEGFHNGTVEGDAYEYDPNGNMVVDRNNGIRIRYNQLNLIEEISKASGESVRFGFDADGLKRFRHAVGPNATPVGVLDYVGNCVFQDGTLRLVMHDEGRIVRDSDDETWRFQYFLTDHLGSVRVAFEVPANNSGSGARPTVVYTADYYPRGLRIDNQKSEDVDEAPVKHLFAGKELQEVMGLQWYDFGARMLDPAIGRWFVPDPEAERHPSVTPYAYVLNNPIRHIDPDGRDGWEFNAFGQTWVPPWSSEAAGILDTLKAYGEAGEVAAAGIVGGAAGGAVSGCVAGAGVGVSGAIIGAAPGCGAGAIGGGVGGAFAGLISAAFEDTPSSAATSGLLSGLVAGPFGGAAAAVEKSAAVLAGAASAASAVGPALSESESHHAMRVARQLGFKPEAEIGTAGLYNRVGTAAEVSRYFLRLGIGGTIAETWGGAYLNALERQGVAMARWVWPEASEQYAKSIVQTGGKAVFLRSGTVSPTSIFVTHEAPILQAGRVPIQTHLRVIQPWIQLRLPFSGP